MPTHIACPSIICACLLAAAPAALRADTIILTPVKDNSIYSESFNAAGAFEHIFAGRTAMGSMRRALIQFDLSAIPAGSVIDAATLQLHVTMVSPTGGPREVSLHRLEADWGEGTSAPLLPGGTGALPTPGSATWAHRFYDADFWASPGGDYAATASASGMVAVLGPYQWTDPGLAADLQLWLDSPAANFGWIVLGDEAAFGTARRFASREAADPAERPTLTITFTPPSACYADCDENDILNIDDFLCFINAFAAQDPYADCDDNQIFNIDDFLCFIDEFAQGCP